MNQTANNKRLSKIHKLATGALIVALYVAMLPGEPALAQSAGNYDLIWSTIDGGGGRSSGGPYTLTGTIGQPDAAYSAGDNYELLGGFWPGGPLCIVEFHHYARFAEQWMQTGPNLAADLDGSGSVDWDDLDWFVAEWLNYCPYGWPLK